MPSLLSSEQSTSSTSKIAAGRATRARVSLWMLRHGDSSSQRIDWSILAVPGVTPPSDADGGRRLEKRVLSSGLSAPLLPSLNGGRRPGEGIFFDGLSAPLPPSLEYDQRVLWVLSSDR